MNRHNTTTLMALCLCMVVFICLPRATAALTPALAAENLQNTAVERAEISLSPAIGNIEAATGGRVIMAAVQPLMRPPALMRGPLVYALMVLRDKEPKTYFVEIFTGQVLSQHGAWAGYLTLAAASKDEIFTRAKISLRDAIDMGEKEENGKTVLAKTMLHQGLPCYEITMLAGERYRRVRIDAFNGKIKHVHMGPLDIMPFSPTRMFSRNKK